jgi:hypothetical protein
VDADQAAAATRWLRQRAPRGTRVNLRPLGQRDGLLLARVRTMAGRNQPIVDLGEALVAEGLASPLPESDPLACDGR